MQPTKELKIIIYRTLFQYIFTKSELEAAFTRSGNSTSCFFYFLQPGNFLL